MNYDELMTWVGTGYLMHRGFDREGEPIINKDRNTLFLVNKKTLEIVDFIPYTLDVESFDVNGVPS
mgnify:CR=1 FL=1